ncbi:PQQ-binding-like beta-propeller repeat protein [Streptomyces sp. NPDC085946]|uniref:outer membrane protein assembly factor BamB family protein n=1 Tax=Streptomyces sp. NPDC085946 TaxID=3365744 RepID=UPI0037CD07F1
MTFGPPPSVYTQSALTADDARRRRRRRLLGAVTAAVTALAVGAGGWLLWPGEPEDDATPRAAVRQAPDAVRDTAERIPASPEGRLVVEHSEEDLTKATETSPRYAPGTWATDTVLAKGVAGRVEGYRIDGDGQKAWTLELGGHLCATSRHVTTDGRTAVVVQPPRPDGSAQEGVCDQVVFLDLNTGKKLWQKKMPGAGSAFVTNTNLTLTQGVVAVAWRRGSVAYDMKDGSRLWHGTSASQCQDQGYAGGRALLALEICGETPDATYRVQELDPRTGKPRWTYKVARGVHKVHLPSSDPPVLAVAAGDSSVTDLITLDARGRHRATISLEGYDAKCGNRYFSSPYFGVVENCDGMVVGREQAFVMSEENFGAGQPSDWIVAFDLRTGKTRGKFEGRSLQMVYPLRTNGDELLIYRRAGALAPASVVSWNPRTDKETPFLFFVLPDDDEGELSDPEQSDILVERGRVFFARRTLVQDDEDPEASVLMAIGYGSAGLKH